MGVVHHAEYLVWFELARTRHCEAAGTSYQEIEASGYWLMVTAAALHYRQAARYGDTVRVACWIDRLTRRALRFAYEVTRDGRHLVGGTTDHIWVRASDRKPCTIPAAVESSFRDLAEPRSEAES